MKKKLIFFVAEDWYFVSHRLSLALEAIRNNYEVHLVTNCNKEKKYIESHGILVHEINLVRGSFNLLKELITIYDVIKIYKKVKPDIIHHVAIKPILYGMISARYLKLPNSINSFGGLANLFWSNSPKYRILRPFLFFTLRSVLNYLNSKCILQNNDDLNLLIDNKLLNQSRAIIIRGSGVDTKVFNYSKEKPGTIKVFLASRLQSDKGIYEFINAVKIFKREKIDVEFYLAGMIDIQNPSAIEPKIIKKWQLDGYIKWLGHVDDMPKIMHNAHIVCLPSYREGLPKVLLEAASCGRPIVATNVPGCREIVIDGYNGYLVPPKNHKALYNAIKKLINDKDKRGGMGRNGRALVERDFSIEKICEETIQVYKKIILG
jgi:glycosyltransferase involved in cell wall biosynthesis